MKATNSLSRCILYHCRMVKDGLLASPLNWSSADYFSSVEHLTDQIMGRRRHVYLTKVALSIFNSRRNLRASWKCPSQNALRQEDRQRRVSNTIKDADEIRREKLANYSPPDPSTLGRSIVATHAKKFARKDRRFAKDQSGKSDPSKSLMPGLDSNIFAQILSSPSRLDPQSRLVYPRDILVPFGPISTGDDDSVYLLPIREDIRSKVPRKRVYFHPSPKGLEKFHKAGLKSIKRLIDVPEKRLVHVDQIDASKLRWPSNAGEILTKVLLHDMTSVYDKVTKHCESPPENGQTYYKLLWTDVTTPYSVDELGNVVFHIPSSAQISPPEGQDYLYITGSNCIPFLKCLWRHYLSTL
uniref:ARAD1C08910p n=1 Tax=Blastobotrys adeninivorans TaxID=409370 RepID=A0A060T0K5_BLAAD